MQQDWGNFFDQAPTTEAAIPVAAMRAAVRPSGGAFGKSVALPAARSTMPTMLVQGQQRQPDMTPPQMPEPPKSQQQSNEWGDIAKSVAGIVNPEEPKEKGDGFGDRMKEIDQQLEEMRVERQKALDAIKASGTPTTASNMASKSVAPGGQGDGSNASGSEGFNYNVGNLRTSGVNWAGKGAPHNGFETFDTPQSGASAMFHNLSSYAASAPGMTMAGAINKWAPPSENNTSAYVAHVAQQAGIDPNTPLAQILADPDAAAKMMMAMARMEKGNGLHSAFTHELFRTVAGAKKEEKKEAGNAEGGRIRYLRSLVGA